MEDMNNPVDRDSSEDMPSDEDHCRKILYEEYILPVRAVMQDIQALGKTVALRSEAMDDPTDLIDHFEAETNLLLEEMKVRLVSSPFEESSPLIQDIGRVVIHTLRGILHIASMQTGILAIHLRAGNVHLSPTWLQDRIHLRMLEFSVPPESQSGANDPETVKDTQSLRELFEHARISCEQERIPCITTGLAGDVADMPIEHAWLMRLVLQEYCLNAIDAGATHVAISAHQTENFLELVINDDGPGIPDDIRRAVYEEGRRGLTTKEHGSGQGMATNKDLIEDLGGKVEAERNTIGGARIRIRLPRADSNRRPQDAEF